MNLFSQDGLLTVAEKYDFKSTSTYKDVNLFIEKLKKSSPFIRVEKIAISADGWEIPLLVIANPLPKSPGELVNDKRIVVYVQANIHGGRLREKRLF